MSCKCKTESCMNGFLWGLVGGAVLGMLFAPQDGEKSRELVKQKLDELKIEADKRLKELEVYKSKLPGFKSDVEEHVTKAKQRVKEEIQTAKDALELHLAEKQQG